MTPLKEAFYFAIISQTEIAQKLGWSSSFVSQCLSGKKLNKSSAKQLWKLLPQRLRTRKLAGEIAQMLLENSDVLEFCSVDKGRAFAWLEFN